MAGARPAAPVLGSLSRFALSTLKASDRILLSTDPALCDTLSCELMGLTTQHARCSGTYTYGFCFTWLGVLKKYALIL